MQYPILRQTLCKYMDLLKLAFGGVVFGEKRSPLCSSSS